MLARLHIIISIKPCVHNAHIGLLRERLEQADQSCRSTKNRYNYMQAHDGRKAPLWLHAINAKPHEISRVSATFHPPTIDTATTCISGSFFRAEYIQSVDISATMSTDN